MGSWAAAITVVFSLLFGIWKAVVWYKSKEYKDQEAEEESLEKARKTRKAQDVLSYFNRRNRRR